MRGIGWVSGRVKQKRQATHCSQPTGRMDEHALIVHASAPITRRFSSSSRFIHLESGEISRGDENGTRCGDNFKKIWQLRANSKELLSSRSSKSFFYEVDFSFRGKLEGRNEAAREVCKKQRLNKVKWRLRVQREGKEWLNLTQFLRCKANFRK